MRLKADKGELGLALFFAAVGVLWLVRGARMSWWDGFAPDSGFLPLIYGILLTALANWTAVVPQMRRILVGADTGDRARLRASVKEAARRLVAR